MKVALNPAVSFKSNLIEERLKNFPPVQGFQNGVEESAPEKPQVSIDNEDAYISRDLMAEEKVADFEAALKNKKWEKKYLPESDIVFIKQKKVQDDVEYILEKDGTVKEAGLGIKSSVVMEPNSKMAEVFNDIKAKSTKGTNKKPGNFFTRAISDIWTTFSVAGTMTTATAKGLFYGALTGAGVIAASTILNMSKLLGENVKFLDILKNPMKSAGKSGRIIAAVASAVVLASYMIAGKLNANENAAVIDHKMHTGHRDA